MRNRFWSAARRSAEGAAEASAAAARNFRRFIVMSEVSAFIARRYWYSFAACHFLLPVVQYQIHESRRNTNGEDNQTHTRASAADLQRHRLFGRPIQTTQ